MRIPNCGVCGASFGAAGKCGALSIHQIQRLPNHLLVHIEHRKKPDGFLAAPKHEQTVFVSAFPKLIALLPAWQVKGQ